MSNDQVRVEKVIKKFGDVIAINEITLSVGKGEFLTLLGPSGCGKTTLLRTIAGFEEPDSGQVYIGGLDVTNEPPHKRPANMVFQRYALFPHLSVFENVAFGLRVKKLNDTEIKHRVEGMLALCQLPGFGPRKVNQLSGGQAQRVALARALVNKPDVLLLDEPLAALDLKIRQQMQMELKLIHAELGLTFIYVTHDQEEAMTISNRIIVMRDGQLVQDGTPEEIYNYPINAYVADFIGHSNLVEGLVQSLTPVRLDFLGKSFACKPCEDLQIGQKVKALLRPEVIMVYHEEPSQTGGYLEGVVIDATFKGPYLDYLIDIDQLRIKVHQSIHNGVQIMERGEKAYLTWSPDDILVLTA